MKKRPQVLAANRIFFFSSYPEVNINIEHCHWKLFGNTFLFQTGGCRFSKNAMFIDK